MVGWINYFNMWMWYMNSLRDYIIIGMWDNLKKFNIKSIADQFLQLSYRLV